MRRQELHPRTAVINKTQKNQSKRARQRALIWLKNTFPQAFDNTESIHPFKIGIMEDILKHADEAEALGISRSKLREALVVYTRRIDYLTCLKAREMRIDLHGNPVDQVSEDEANKASLKIKKRVEKCAYNARKLLESKEGSTGQGSRALKPTTPSPSNYPFETNPYVAERPPLFSMTNTNTPSKTPTVQITRKSTKPYDPEAVARLKEKLGLTSKADAEKETSESD